MWGVYHPQTALCGLRPRGRTQVVQAAARTGGRVPFAPGTRVIQTLTPGFILGRTSARLEELRLFSLGGAATSTSARLRRCCATSTSGPGDGCAPSPGSSGNAGLLGSPSCDAAASAGILAAQTAGSPHGPWRLSNSPALTIALPSLPRLARPNFPAPGTRVIHGDTCGGCITPRPPSAGCGRAAVHESYRPPPGPEVGYPLHLGRG